MDRETDDRIIIESVREDGRAFRPNDWIERMSALLATFGPDHRLHYASSVQPCIIGGEKCLVMERGLAQNNPAAYEFILKFARDNALRIQEERRQQARPA